MKKQARKKILSGLLSLLLVLFFIVSQSMHTKDTGTIDLADVKAATVTTDSVNSTASDDNLADDVQDGVIFHAWNWSYSTIEDHLYDLAEAGFSTVQTSPVQQPKDYSSSYTDVSGQWWKLYQPCSFSIATNSWLGDADDLAELCDAADNYGIKIICDIVVNHMANDGNSSTALNSLISQYEPTIYNDYSSYFHSYVTCSDDSIQGVVQGNIGMADLNTSNSYVQERVISLLEECVDCGVDGFRFDAAKHIETPSDGSYASDFWSNVLSAATSYASSTQGIDLYYYGEILNTAGNGRNFSDYIPYMSITDNVTGNMVRANVVNGNASGAYSSYYYTELDAENLVLWAESHDTYNDSSSSGVSTSDIHKTWAIIASRADATSLYFARPGSATMGACGSTDFTATEVAAVNFFHNHFGGASEYLSYSGNIVMNERYYTEDGTDGGAVLVNVSGTSTDVSNMTVNRLGDGTYIDEITENTFVVSDGKISGTIGSTGIAVLYYEITSTTPANTISPSSGTFSTDTLSVTVGLENATSGTYQIGSTGEEITYDSSTTFTIGEDMDYNESVTIYLTATDGSATTSDSYTFTKVSPEEVETITVYFSNNYGWSSVYAYYWGGENPSDAWPGNQMTYVKNNEYNEGVYSIEIPTDITGLIFNSGSGEQTADITSGFEDGIGYYISGGSSNAYTVGTYTYQ